MKFSIAISFLFAFITSHSQVWYLYSDSKNVFQTSYHWMDDAYLTDTTLTKDTLYLPILLKHINNYIIYYDKKMSVKLTEVKVDSLNSEIVFKHYNRSGNLIREIKATYSPLDKSNYNLNPEYHLDRRLNFYKVYKSDKLISEITREGEGLFCEYNNPFSKVKFKQRHFNYGKIIWVFDQNNNLKSFCVEHDESKFLKDGTYVSERFYESIKFDENGCIKKE